MYYNKRYVGSLEKEFDILVNKSNRNKKEI